MKRTNGHSLKKKNHTREGDDIYSQGGEVVIPRHIFCLPLRPKTWPLWVGFPAPPSALRLTSFCSPRPYAYCVSVMQQKNIMTTQDFFCFFGLMSCYTMLHGPPLHCIVWLATAAAVFFGANCREIFPPPQNARCCIPPDIFIWNSFSARLQELEFYVLFTVRLKRHKNGCCDCSKLHLTTLQMAKDESIRLLLFNFF